MVILLMWWFCIIHLHFYTTTAVVPACKMVHRFRGGYGNALALHLRCLRVTLALRLRYSGGGSGGGGGRYWLLLPLLLSLLVRFSHLNSFSFCRCQWACLGWIDFRCRNNGSTTDCSDASIKLFVYLSMFPHYAVNKATTVAMAISSSPLQYMRIKFIHDFGSTLF